MSASAMGVYLEYAAYFPNRSGSEVAYLEQAYPRPRYFFPVTFAVQSVILSFSSGNAMGSSKARQNQPNAVNKMQYSPSIFSRYVTIHQHHGNKRALPSQDIHW